MTAINDIYQVKLFSTGLNTPVTALNVFWFRLTFFGLVGAGGHVAHELALGFGSNTVAIANDIVSTATTYTKIEVVNYGDPTDFDLCIGDCLLPSNGARVGDSLPASDCWSFRYVRPGPGFRNGYKRFMGPSEEDVKADGTADVAAVVLLNLLSDALEAEIETPLEVLFEPVVARGTKILGVNPGYQGVSTVQYAGVGSQNSRKRPLA